MKSKKLNRIIIKEELVDLTGDFKLAIILNQMIYWSERVKDFDHFVLEEKSRLESEDIETKLDLKNGWIYKSSEELAEETMLGISASSMRTQLKKLIEKGFLSERTNPRLKWDRTKQYRVNMIKIQRELLSLGYVLDNYSLKGVDSAFSKIENATDEKRESNSEKEVIEDVNIGVRTEENTGAIPETITETTLENTTHNKDACDVVCLLEDEVTVYEAEKLVKISNNDKKLISEKYEIAKTLGYRNLMGFMIRAIREDWQMPKRLEHIREVNTSFHNFKGRTKNYTADELEKLVLSKG